MLYLTSKNVYACSVYTYSCAYTYIYIYIYTRTHMFVCRLFLLFWPHGLASPYRHPTTRLWLHAPPFVPIPKPEQLIKSDLRISILCSVLELPGTLCWSPANFATNPFRPETPLFNLFQAQARICESVARALDPGQARENQAGRVSTRALAQGRHGFRRSPLDRICLEYLNLKAMSCKLLV